MKTEKVRPVAIGIIRLENRILVHQGYDSHKQQTFYRPLGGKIEFSELGAQTVAREFVEEIGQEVTNPRYLFTVENIFVFDGQPKHEIMLVFQVDFANLSNYQESSFTLVEDDGRIYQAIWKDLSEFSPETPLYPECLLEYLVKHS